jgi:tripartite-type tricarboxylate transporter receptor subunit TctC
VLDFHRTGKIRILAVCAPARLKAAPEIPAAVETLPGLVVQLTCGVLAAKSTPKPIVVRLSDVTKDAVKQPDFDRVLQAAGLEESSNVTPDDAQAFLAGERQRLIPIIKAAGLQPQ